MLQLCMSRHEWRFHFDESEGTDDHEQIRYSIKNNKDPLMVKTFYMYMV